MPSSRANFAVLAALRRDRSVDLDRFGVALYDARLEAWRTLTELDDEVAVGDEARAELYDTLAQETDDAADEAGYFGIGIVRGKTAGNAGVLWRSAAQLGAAFTFTRGVHTRGCWIEVAISEQISDGEAAPPPRG